MRRSTLCSFSLGSSPEYLRFGIFFSLLKTISHHSDVQAFNQVVHIFYLPGITKQIANCVHNDFVAITSKILPFGSHHTWARQHYRVSAGHETKVLM